MSDIVIVVPTKRPPPIQTFVSYHIPANVNAIIVADPDVSQAHRDYYLHHGSRIAVERGAPGMGAQVAACYAYAHQHGYPWLFRVDDDLAPKTFVHKDGTFPSLEEAIQAAHWCAIETETTLTGFQNTTRRDWMGEGYGRTYGLIHGGANLCKSTPVPALYIDPSLRRFEDVYRSCAHRLEAGAVGRVKFIGVDKSKSVGGAKSSNVLTKEQIEEARDLVLAKFPGMVTCDGLRSIHNGETWIPNWRFKRTPK